MIKSEMRSGRYGGMISDVDVRESKKGNEMVMFAWTLENGVTVKSYHTIQNVTDGTVFEKNVKILKREFPGWDGEEANWFLDHAGELIGTEGIVTIAMEAWNGIPMPSVKYMSVAKATGSKACAPYAPPPPPQGPAVQPELTLNGAWREFCLAHAGLDKPQLDAAWYALADRVFGPGKDQLSCTPEDWGRLIAAIRAEKVAK